MSMQRLFLDETIVKSNGVQERSWFGLVGCVLSLEEHGRALRPAFEALKTRFFNHHSDAAPVVFHRMDMCARSPRGAFAILKEDDIRRSLYEELFRIIRNCDFRVIVELEQIR